jgi:hypothetical protein
MVEIAIHIDGHNPLQDKAAEHVEAEPQGGEGDGQIPS